MRISQQTPRGPDEANPQPNLGKHNNILMSCK
jgi:hypothetical protein